MTAAPLQWLSRCFPEERIDVDVLAARRGGSGCPVYFVDGMVGSMQQRLVVKVYAPGFDDYSGLGPHDTARKHALALEELGGTGLPVPDLVAWCRDGTAAAVITRWIEASESGLDRREAAANLARLHRTELADMGPVLADLIERSRSNRDRIRRGVVAMAPQCDEAVPEWRSASPELSGAVDGVLASAEPEAGTVTLQHGDYFSVNLLPDATGITIVDWDLLARGDPMWDLGHLLGADPDDDPNDGAIVDAYRDADGPFDREMLRWRLRCWQAFWGLRRVLEPSETAGKVGRLRGKP
jgi:aminoglycoside phosphotransferase (APT) family kinase protein